MNPSIRLLLASVCAMFLRSKACADDGAAALRVLTTHCGSCHGKVERAKGGFFYVLERELLVGRGKVVPGKPEESELLQRIASGDMPPPTTKLRPNTEEVATLRRWIANGAPAATPSTVTPAPALPIVVADLRGLDLRRRRFVRYLTLGHLPPGPARETARLGLVKLVNALSWHPRLTPPHSVDPAGTTYRIDLRDYRWTDRLWERLVAEYPYRLSLPLDAIRFSVDATGSTTPAVRGDWFLATASRPPLYADLLQLPATDRALERLLQVDVVANIRDGTAKRAGFNGSGVSRNNRAIERHDAAYGAYWRSYDFAANTGRQNLFEHPLGPPPGPRSFVAAGGEMLFHLPNGMLGSLLVDAAGKRLDRAPVEIVSDPLRPDRTIENGLSCLSCHARGFLPKADQVRRQIEVGAAAFTAEQVDEVRALYPPMHELDALFKEDNERVSRALVRLGLASVEVDPVNAATLRYEAPLGLAEAAAECGLTPAEFVRRLREARELARALGPLAAHGTVQRPTFQALFAELARTLRLDGGAAAPAVAANPAFRPFHGHIGAVLCVAWSRDGNRVASGCEDRTVRLWDVATGRELRRFEGHAEAVTSVAFAPDGHWVYSGSRDRTIRGWNTADGASRKYLGHTDAIAVLAVAPDGRLLLSGSDDRTVRLWDVAPAGPVAVLGAANRRITAVAFSPDGRRAVAGSHDGAVREWTVTSRLESGAYVGHSRAVYALVYAADGKWLATGGEDAAVRLWDVAAGRGAASLPGSTGAVIALAFAPDGRLLVGNSRYRGGDPWLRRATVDLAGLRPEPSPDETVVGCAAIAPDGRRALSGSPDGTLRLWQLGD